MDANLFGHLANVLFGCAYLVKDILWLRAISIVACCIMIFFNYYSPEEPLWVAIFWNAAFIVVNAVHSFLLMLERKQAQFLGSEKEMYDSTFLHMAPVEFAKVLRAGHWKYYKPDTPILQEGERPNALILLFSGKARVNKAEDKRGVALNDGVFIGEMSLATDGVASASVKAESEIKAFCWPLLNLERLFKENPNLKASFQMIIASDMARKLKLK